MISTEPNKDAINRYIDFFENLTGDTLPELKNLVTTDVRFRDPFNDVVGAARMQNVFTNMLRDTEKPKFKIYRKVVDAQYCFIKWTFAAQSRVGPLQIDGVSEIVLDDSGRVKTHIDYWDTGETIYEKVPIIGPVLRFIRRRIGATS